MDAAIRRSKDLTTIFDIEAIQNSEAFATLKALGLAYEKPSIELIYVSPGDNAKEVLRTANKLRLPHANIFTADKSRLKQRQGYFARRGEVLVINVAPDRLAAAVPSALAIAGTSLAEGPIAAVVLSCLSAIFSGFIAMGFLSRVGKLDFAFYSFLVSFATGEKLTKSRLESFYNTDFPLKVEETNIDVDIEKDGFPAVMDALLRNGMLSSKNGVYHIKRVMIIDRCRLRFASFDSASRKLKRK